MHVTRERKREKKKKTGKGKKGNLVGSCPAVCACKKTGKPVAEGGGSAEGVTILAEGVGGGG